MRRVHVFRNRRDHEDWRERMKRRKQANEARKMIEASEKEEAARELAGTAGHYITPIGDKRGAFDPSGMLLIIKSVKAEAERCAIEHATTGSIKA